MDNFCQKTKFGKTIHGTGVVMIGEDFEEPKKDKNMNTAVKEVAEKPGKVEENPPVSVISPKVVLGNVLRQLGKPGNMSKESPSLTRATAVTQNSFRVNIYLEEYKSNFWSSRLGHSFFVKVDEKGKVINSTPEIVKQYE